jgi:iron complex outermembrane receptor protein
MKRLFVPLFLLSLSPLFGEDLTSLLDEYQESSDLSNITKKESAGFLELYTRKDLEQMQVKNLQDILRIIPGFTLSRTSNNLTSLSKPTLSTIDLTAVRLYINDHDMSSSSFGSAFLIWGELPVEYIDHIEVYKGSSSIEFGNECAAFIIKLYTKTAQREEGGKIRLIADNQHSTNADLYIASTVDDFSYFAYGNFNNINRTHYTNTYNDKTYDIASDHNGYNLYANLHYKNTTLELGSYTKKSDNFLGMGTHRTPTGGGLNTYQNYLHLTQKFDQGLKLQLSYDKLSYKRGYLDPNGMRAANLDSLQEYHIKFDDDILSAIAEQHYTTGKHTFLFGTFFKQKRFKEYGAFEGTTLYTNSFSNALDLYSAYVEYTYDYSQNTRFVASLKDDYFHYHKDIATNNELIARMGVIQNISNYQLKAFVTKSYIPTPFYKLYNPENTPYKANPNLKNAQLYIATASIRYKTKKQHIEFLVAANKAQDAIIYDRTTPNRYLNSKDTIRYLRYDLRYYYFFDKNNKILVDFFSGKNSKDIITSPQYNGVVRLFNRYKKFDFYNELIYKSAYSSADISMDASFNFNTSLKYHFSQDLSFGLRGEDILNDSYEQAYRGYNKAIPVSDRKLWINMEYLF